MGRTRGALAPISPHPEPAAFLESSHLPSAGSFVMQPRIPRFLPAAIALALAGLAASPAPAAPLPGPVQSAVDRFLQEQTAGLPGTVSFRVDAPARLPECAAPEPFLAAGVRPWGRFSLGLRCPGERPWTRFLPAQVTVEGTYYVAVRPIGAGQALATGDFAARSGDLTRLPPSVATDPGQLEGLQAANAIASGAPLRRDLLQGAIVIQQGQPVRLVAAGAGFTASTEATALTRAAAGTTVQVRTTQGRVVSGVAGEDGRVTLGAGRP